MIHQISWDVNSLVRAEVLLSNSETTTHIEFTVSTTRVFFLQIFSDSVGYGFVIRGIGPTYVQTVDPEGPAADAGLKVVIHFYPPIPVMVK